MLQYSLPTQQDTILFNITRYLSHDTVLPTACIRQNSCVAQGHDKIDSLYTTVPTPCVGNTDVYD